ncbi:F-box/kelch-repeat protein At3g06240-like [Papaver somniferum]|uniref:F-box/kelch-repeat protein At3g06240-like n=1 Tax=Papaver somniferum TaxID=3469 RepID=UPI000E6F836B|nr:F-box/kelch-repeat protein At3g06240-like [Papaver somniferum]
MDYPSLSQDCVIKFLGSCNGLLCICCSRYDYGPYEIFSDGICYHHDSGCCCQGQEIHLWNPSTKEYKRFPTLPQRPSSYVDIDSYGFGYDYKFDDYKLLRFIDDDDDSVDLDVYSLKSNSWKTIQNIPYSPSQYYIGGGLVNGALHWFASTKAQDSKVLVSFDIIYERFKEVSLPQEPIPNPKTDPGISLEDDEPMCDLAVEVLGGCLCLVYHVFNIRADIWVMQDYGVKESWTKSFSIRQEEIISHLNLWLIWSFKNNEILVVADKLLCLYDPNNKTYKKLKLHDLGKTLVADKFIGDENDESVDLDIYSLKSNSWKTIQNIMYSASKGGNTEDGVLVNGALHWFATTKGQDSEVLISFDIVNERFKEVALPQEPIPNPKTDPGISLEDDMLCDLDGQYWEGVYVYCFRFSMSGQMYG